MPNVGKLVSGLRGLFKRSGPFPALNFHLGGDVFVSPFLGHLSLRKYVAYRSQYLYPTGYGRTFTLEQWRTIIKYMKHITEALLCHGPDSVSFDLIEQGCPVIIVRSDIENEPPIERGVAFIQEGREDFVLSRSQWLELVKHAKVFLTPGVLAAAPPASSLQTLAVVSSHAAITPSHFSAAPTDSRTAPASLPVKRATTVSVPPLSSKPAKKKRLTKKQQLEQLEQQQRLLTDSATISSGSVGEILDAAIEQYRAAPPQNKRGRPPASSSSKAKRPTSLPVISPFDVMESPLTPPSHQQPSTSVSAAAGRPPPDGDDKDDDEDNDEEAERAASGPSAEGADGSQDVDALMENLEQEEWSDHSLLEQHNQQADDTPDEVTILASSPPILRRQG